METLFIIIFFIVLVLFLWRPVVDIIIAILGIPVAIVLVIIGAVSSLFTTKK